jgi:hypothetical protein
MHHRPPGRSERRIVPQRLERPARQPAAARLTQEDPMHPLILQQLVTDRVNDMIATAADLRRARGARRTRRARTSGRRTPPGLPGTQPEFQPAASPTRATG